MSLNIERRKVVLGRILLSLADPLESNIKHDSLTGATALSALVMLRPEGEEILSSEL